MRHDQAGRCGVDSGYKVIRKIMSLYVIWDRGGRLGGYIPLRFSSRISYLRNNWLDQKNDTKNSDDDVLVSLTWTVLLTSTGILLARFI
jgi:hypothetical protein